MAMAGCWPLFICFASGQSKRQPITEFSTEFCVLRRSSRMSIADEFFCQITEFYRVLPSFFFLRRRGHASHHVPSFVLFFYLVRPLFFFKLHHINVLRFDPTRNEPSKTR